MSYSGPFAFPVKAGGTGQATLTNHGVLVGAGTNSVTQLTVGSNGQVLLGSSTADPAFATLTSSGSSLSYTTGANSLNIDITAPVSIANGGTNATSMATTDGTVYYDGTRLVTTATGTAGQVLTSGGAGVAPSYSSAGATSTGWVFISKQTASGGATLTFTSGITATYKNYVLLFSSMIPTTAGDFIVVQLSTNSGSSYIATGYTSGINRMTISTATFTNANVTTWFYAGGQVNGTAGLNCAMYLYSLTNNVNPSSSCNFVMQQSGPTAGMGIAGGTYNSAIIVNALQVSASSGGNITSGTVSLFGIKEA